LLSARSCCSLIIRKAIIRRAGIPCAIQDAADKKPGKRANPEEVEQYNKLKKEKNLSTQALDVVRDLRASLDQRDGAGPLVVDVGDGARQQDDVPRLIWIHPSSGSLRKDARCALEPQKEARKYDEQLFIPTGAQQEDRPGTCAGLPGCKRRMVRYKEVKRRFVEARAGD